LANLKGKVILLTGGTGSFGQSFVEEALKHNSGTIRIFSRGEYLQLEMQRHFNNSKLRFLIGDVRDMRRLHRAMDGVDMVVHAAALKQGPTWEYNPIEAIRTNIDGTINIIDAAINGCVDKVLAISSDKAVHPINLYGATKLAMEKLIIQANVYGDTKFSCLRCGNFWGSRGSVIPLWEKQAEQGTIDITDGDMTRFWIELNDVAQFTLDCLDRMEGGEIFIPKMRRQTLSWVAERVAPKATINFIGKRAGEKKHEALFAEGEGYEEFKDYFVIR